MDEQNTLISLTADIVAAHLANNTVAINDVPNLVRNVHDALAGLGGPAPAPEPEKKVAVIGVRASIKPDYLVCMECGGKHKMLKRHIGNAHGMTPEQYRADYGLPKDYPMVAPNYSEQRRTLAHSIGLGRKPKAATGAAKPARGGRRKKVEVEGSPETEA